MGYFDYDLWSTYSIPTKMYERGKLVDGHLEIIDSAGNLLRKGGPADSFRAAQVASQFVIGVNSAFRSMGEQRRLYDAWLTYKRRGGPKASLAAKPGWSNHQGGLSVDITKGAGRTFMRDNGAAFGWHANVSTEPWHFTYLPTYGK